MTLTEVQLTTIRSQPKEWLAGIIRAGHSELAIELVRDHPELLQTRFSGNVTPLQVAAFARQREIADSLCAMGAKLDFITAIALGRTGTVRAMLSRDPNLIHKCAPEGGWTALHIGAGYADTELMTLLISFGGGVNARDRRGLTPIFFATGTPYSNAELLLANGADVNAHGKHGFTALHYAAAAGNTSFVSFLLTHGADANAQTDARQTPWALAVRRGHQDVVLLLQSRKTRTLETVDPLPPL